MFVAELAAQIKYPLLYCSTLILSFACVYKQTHTFLVGDYARYAVLRNFEKQTLVPALASQLEVLFL